MSRLLDHLRGHGEKVAVLTDSQQLSYHQLADAVADTARELGGPRRLVLLETRNDLTTLVRYLAAMAGGHACCLSMRGATTPRSCRRMNPTS